MLRFLRPSFISLYTCTYQLKSMESTASCKLSLTASPLRTWPCRPSPSWYGCFAPLPSPPFQSSLSLKSVSISQVLSSSGIARSLSWPDCFFLESCSHCACTRRFLRLLVRSSHPSSLSVTPSCPKFCTLLRHPFLLIHLHLCFLYLWLACGFSFPPLRTHYFYLMPRLRSALFNDSLSVYRSTFMYL